MNQTAAEAEAAAMPTRQNKPPHPPTSPLLSFSHETVPVCVHVEYFISRDMLECTSWGGSFAFLFAAEMKTSLLGEKPPARVHQFNDFFILVV